MAATLRITADATDLAPRCTALTVHAARGRGRPRARWRLHPPKKSRMRPTAAAILRLARVSLTIYSLLNAPALAQMPATPGPGGISIAPGSPVAGYTPGGIGPGGTAVSPGPAARGIPMYRSGSGGVPIAPRPDPLPSEPNIAR